MRQTNQKKSRVGLMRTQIGPMKIGICPLEQYSTEQYNDKERSQNAFILIALLDP